MNIIPRVVDISHHNEVLDFGQTANAGIWGIIHKATQGTAYIDPYYHARRKMAQRSSLLWGAYHFNTGEDVNRQVDWFLFNSKPDENTLVVLDYEDYRLSNMGIGQMVDFCHLIEQKLGRKCAIYSGNRLKETIKRLGQSDRSYIQNHRLWLCQYGRTPTFPDGFKGYWLWQFTGDGVGPLPHSIPGIGGRGIDLNTFQGVKDELVASWSGKSLIS